MTKTYFYVLSLLLAASQGQAGLNVCNQTDLRASVAIGYNQDGTWTSEGWWIVDPGSCKTVVGGALSKRYYYWHATNSNGAFSGENYTFCTRSEVFTIAGDNDCAQRGYNRADFNEVDTDRDAEFIITLEASKAPSRASGAVKKSPSPPQDVVAPPPGTYGEPFTIVAEFLGCYQEGATRSCDFYTDGYYYLASTTNPTMPSIFDDLANFSEGTMFEITGDMISYEGESVEITIRDFDIAPDDAPSNDTASDPGSYGGDVVQHVQGFWDSDDDSAYSLLFQGDVLTEFYDANLMQRSFFQVYPECAASNGLGPVIIAYPDPDEGDGPSCYLVIEMGPRSLILRNMVAGGDLSFSFARDQ